MLLQLAAAASTRRRSCPGSARRSARTVAMSTLRWMSTSRSTCAVRSASSRPLPLFALVHQRHGRASTTPRRRSRAVVATGGAGVRAGVNRASSARSRCSSAASSLRDTLLDLSQRSPAAPIRRAGRPRCPPVVGAAPRPARRSPCRRQRPPRRPGLRPHRQRPGATTARGTAVGIAASRPAPARRRQRIRRGEREARARSAAASTPKHLARVAERREFRAARAARLHVRRDRRPFVGLQSS